MTATDLKSSRVFEGRGCLLARDDVDEGSRIPRYLPRLELEGKRGWREMIYERNVAAMHSVWLLRRLTRSLLKS